MWITWGENALFLKNSKFYESERINGFFPNSIPNVLRHFSKNLNCHKIPIYKSISRNMISKASTLSAHQISA